jgi:hypothetical protein
MTTKTWMSFLLCMLRAKLMALVVLGIVLALPGLSQAQGFYVVDYFDNAGTWPDGKVRISNVGLVPGTATGVGDQCALIYVFDSDQQLAECCGCRITPNGLIKLSINDNLTSNALTSVAPVKGTIHIVASNPNAAATTPPAGSSAGCNPSLPPVQTAQSTLGTIAAWSTHVQDTGELTEGNFVAGGNNTGINSYNSAAGVAGLAAKCLFNVVNGSGHGLCSCTTDALDSWIR